MPVSLDTLLFWCGLALLCVGLFVFLTGKKVSDESKKESNRFEAFGIKIDVNNPSLILIMLGAVMMLSPKFIPEEVKEAASPVQTAEESSAPPTSSAQQASPAAAPSSLAGSNTPVPETPRSAPVESSRPTPIEVPATNASSANAASRDAVVVSPPPSVSPAAQQIPTPVAQERSLTQQPPKVAAPPPAAIKPLPAKPEPVPVPEPVTPEPLVTTQAPAPAALMVSVVADVSDRAGIHESAEAYARRASKEIAQRAGEIFSVGVSIDSGTLAELRSHLEKGEEDYATLCRKCGRDTRSSSTSIPATGMSSPSRRPSTIRP